MRRAAALLLATLAAGAAAGDAGSPSRDLGEYALDDDGVVLQAVRHDRTPYEIRLRHVPSAQAVFFDAPRTEPVEVEALTAGESCDDAWCRAYPGPEGPP